MEDPPLYNIPTLDKEYNNVAKDIDNAILIDALKIKGL